MENLSTFAGPDSGFARRPQVPWGWPYDPKLANWVHDQRHLKRKLDLGEPHRATRLPPKRRI